MSPSVPSQDEDQHQQCHHDHHPHGSSMSPSVPSQDEDQHQQCHNGHHHPHVSRTQLCSQDNDEEDLQQQCYQDDDPNLIILGRVDTDALSEVNAGNGESMEMINKENKPLNDTAVQEETTIQEESQTGALKPQERVFSQSGHPTVANIVTGMFPQNY